jgi:hypothetical protein
MTAQVIVLVPNDSFADVMMHRPRYSPEVVPAERVSMMLEYLVKRVQGTATRNNHPGEYMSGATKPTYSDDIVLNAFKVCMTLGMREPLRDLATAFQNKVPDFAIQSLQDLISTIGFEEIKHM